MSHMNPLSLLKSLDKNGDGTIGEEDFVLAAKQMGLGFLGEMAVRQAFKQIDTNRNGRLDLNECMSAFGKLSKLAQSQPH